eukprot:2928070-Rhodomonas_salina.3
MSRSSYEAERLISCDCDVVRVSRGVVFAFCAQLSSVQTPCPGSTQGSDRDSRYRRWQVDIMALDPRPYHVTGQTYAPTLRSLRVTSSVVVSRHVGA